jgi:hypothetical protein
MFGFISDHVPLRVSHFGKTLTDYQEFWERLDQATRTSDSTLQRLYYGMTAKYIDDFVIPTGKLLPTTPEEKMRFSRIRKAFDGFEQSNRDSDEFKAFCCQPFVVTGNEDVDMLKWHYLIEKPQVQRDMIDFLGKERVEPFLEAVRSWQQHTVDPALPSGDIFAAQFSQDLQKARTTEEKHYYQTPLQEPSPNLTPADGQSHEEAEHQSRVQRTKPSGTWVGWQNENKPQIPYTHKNNGLTR